MDTVGRIRKKMDDLGIKQKDLVKHLEVNQGTFAKWLSLKEDNRRDIPNSMLIKIAEYLNTSVDFLLGSAEIKPVAVVPVIGTASCGASQIDFNQEESRTCYYNGEFFHNELYCVIADGESMAPELETGDEVIVDPRREPVHGDIVHYSIDGESAIKVLIIDNDAHIIQLIPFNQSEDFKIRTIRMDDEDSFNELKMHPVVAINKLRFQNKQARLRLVGRS